MSHTGEPSKFSEKTLHPLANGIGRDRIRFGNVLAGVSVELDLNEKIELRVAEQPVGDAAMQKVPQHGLAFHELVVQERQGLELLLTVAGSMNRAFSTSPFEELPLHSARNCKRKVRLAAFDLLRAQHLQKHAQSLLGNVGARKPRLLLGDTANCAVQHGNKGHDHQGLDKLRLGGTSRQQIVEQVIRGRAGLGRLQVG